ncbi:MBL fold metallo-hydrolase [Nonomuraea sp. NPDC049649]|uniref:MBL fold metallo-hydrolase n=1 Tax=Nonomuraea sp. NPDC049649 TaxID=3155776 RepID=UPI0034236F1B
MTEIIDAPKRTGGFRDRLTDRPSGWREVFSIAWHGLFPPDLRDAARIPIAGGGLPPVAAGETSVTWVGHATYLIRTGGLAVLTDPVWSRRIPGVRARLTPPGLAWEELPPIDAVVISHDHYDHLDWPTVRRLPRGTPMLVPAGLGKWFTGRGFTEVIELDWWESATVGGVSFEFVPAHHWSRRTLFDFCRTLWGGWVIGGSVYFAGDTGYGERLARIGARHPGLDLALLPIGAYQPPWAMEPAHLNPPQAVRAFLDLGAQRMATMHWGTFVLSGEPLLRPLEWVREEWAAHGLPGERLWGLAVGESRSF